jgi:DNA-binding MarR family transcriptional regulator
MNIDRFVEKMMELCPRIARSIAHQESDHLSQGKITLPQFWALDHLYRNGPGTMTELSRFLKISRAATTGLIDRLLIQKLIVRKEDKSDRRVVRIEITSRGYHIIKNIHRQKHLNFARIFSKISPADRAEYLRILERIVKIVS